MRGLLWSEHCSYKSSKVFVAPPSLHRARVLQGPAECRRRGDRPGWAAVFKIESHNPLGDRALPGSRDRVGESFATHRDGRETDRLARLAAVWPASASRHHFDAWSPASPATGTASASLPWREVYFDECYAQNPLVNAMCVGLVRVDRLMRARAEGTGNSLMLVGADTGRDGIHGASFASIELDDRVPSAGPRAQVGNPSSRNACSGVHGPRAYGCCGPVAGSRARDSRPRWRSAQDASRRRSAHRVSLVPRRERDDALRRDAVGVEERMLVVVQRGREAEVQRIFQTWD